MPLLRGCLEHLAPHESPLSDSQDEEVQKPAEWDQRSNIAHEREIRFHYLLIGETGNTYDDNSQHERDCRERKSQGHSVVVK
jgi:hypothetical protein